MSNPSPNLCYPVLTPFKLCGVIVKPPAFIQMDAEEAREYQDAGVLGGEDVAGLLPEDGDESSSEQGNGAKESLSPKEGAGAQASPPIKTAAAKKAAAKKGASK